MEFSNNKILIVDDDDIFRKSLTNILLLSKEIQFDVFDAKVGEDAILILSDNQDIECVILDFNFEKWAGIGQMNGLEIAEKIKDISPQIPIIMTSEVGDRGDIAMKAAKSYIHDFLDKPFTKEQLFYKLKTIFHPSEKQQKSTSYTKAIEKVSELGFITKSPNMGKACYDAILAAKSNWNVLIIGETGTGKTQLAKIIHRLSDRKNEKYFELNCGSLTQTLIESELFGHRKGSFTDAKYDKKGIFDLAGNGTLLLDEIGEIPEHIQAKLLYTLGEQKTYSPVGKPEEIITNKARIIAATVLGIKGLAGEDKRIREDLIGRFSQIITLPPLRDRIEDIPLLISKFISEFCEEKHIQNIIIEDDAISLLCRQPWIKNVRQLKDIIQRVITSTLLEERKVINIMYIEEELMDDYGIKTITKVNSIESLTKSLAKKLLENRDKVFKNNENIGGLKVMTSLLERAIIEEALKQSKNKPYVAAKLINENKDTFRNHMENLNLNIEN